MMKTWVLRFELRSAATFGRSDGVAGLVDRETEHDQFGLPYLRGKTLKGLLAEECASLVSVLGEAKWLPMKNRLFGTGGSKVNERGIVHIGDARLPAALCQAVRQQIEEAKLTPELTPKWTRDNVLNSFTSIRRQSAMNEYGAPQHKALRAMRVVLTGTVFESILTFEKDASDSEMGLLAATVLALRHAGTARNRGRGWLRAELIDEEQARTSALFQSFAQEVLS